MTTKPKFENPGFLNPKQTAEQTLETTPEQTPKDTEQYTTQYTNTIMIQPPKKPEPFDQRLVANVTKTQKKYVQKMAKNFENESAFIRYILDLLMANAKLEGKDAD